MTPASEDADPNQDRADEAGVQPSDVRMRTLLPGLSAVEPQSWKLEYRRCGPGSDGEADPTEVAAEECRLLGVMAGG